MEKTEILVEDSAWYCYYSSSYTARRSIDFSKPGKIDTRSCVRRLSLEGLIDSPSDDEDIALEGAEIDNNQVTNGDESEDELARRLVESLPSLREVQGGIARLIDVRYYSVTVDEDRGLAITYLRTSQINRTRTLLVDAQKKLGKRNMRSSNNSFSSMYSQRGFNDYARNAVAWQQWRACWIFSHPVTVDFPHDMPTPAQIAAIEGVPLRFPVDADRSGIISGTDEENAENEESSEDDITSDDELPMQDLGLRLEPSSPHHLSWLELHCIMTSEIWLLFSAGSAH